MFPMTITLHNANQLNAVLNALSATPAPATEVAKAKATEAKKSTPPETPSTPSTGITSESEASDAPSDTGASDGEKTYTLDDAKELTKKTVASGKRDAMVALLAKYAVKQAVLLKPEQIAPFCKEAEGLLK